MIREHFLVLDNMVEALRALRISSTNGTSRPWPCSWRRSPRRSRATNIASATATRPMSIERERTARPRRWNTTSMMSPLVSAAGTRSRAGGVPEPRRSVVRAHDRCGSGTDRRRNRRAINRQWIPVGDDAFFTLRARDVFTIDHLPARYVVLLAHGGAQNLNHPGPLLFDVLALPAKLGGGTGLAIGSALINAMALLGIAIVGYRRGGAVVEAAAVAVGAVLAWSMGSEVLFE